MKPLAILIGIVVVCFTLGVMGYSAIPQQHSVSLQRLLSLGDQCPDALPYTNGVKSANVSGSTLVVECNDGAVHIFYNQK